MNWDAVGPLSPMIRAIAVVISILYLSRSMGRIKLSSGPDPVTAHSDDKKVSGSVRFAHSPYMASSVRAS